MEAFAGQDAVVNCVTGGATQYDPSKLIIDAAIEAGVKFFFANEFVGYVTREQYIRLPETFVGAKYRMRKYLEELGKNGEIKWTSLNGGPFFDMCKIFFNYVSRFANLREGLMKGPAGFDISNRLARIYGTGENNLCWTPLPTIALAAANMLRNPAPVINRPIYICPFPRGQLTQNILLNNLETVLDTKFDVQHIDVAKINRNAKIALERGEGAKAMKGLNISNQFYEADSGNDFSDLVENEVVGVQATTVEEEVRAAIARYGEDSKVVEGMFKVEACEI